jgi:transcriptional regulator with XRE-family HTH domain
MNILNLVPQNKALRDQWRFDLLCASISRQIVAIRSSRGVTQQDFAKGLGVSVGHIQKMERPTFRGHSIGTLHRIAEFFGIAFTIRFCTTEDFLLVISSDDVYIKSWDEEKKENQSAHKSEKEPQ